MAVNLGTAVGYLDLDTSKFQKGFKSALTSVNEFKNGSSGVSSALKGVGSAMTSVGKDMTLKVSAPLVAVGAAAVKASSSLEKGLSKVKAISGATSSDMVMLKDKAIEMGAKTKFSASEAADAFTYMAMAGWKTKDMMDGIDGIMNLSAADGLDLATTSDIVTDAITAFGLSAKDSTHFADVLAAASSNANTNVSMLGESFKYVGPVAGAMGYSVEDVSTALGLMANSGIKASAAGTSLRTLLTNMAKPTDNMAAAMDALGISLSDSSGKVKPLGQLMDELRDHFSNGVISSDEFTKQLFKLNNAWADGKIKDEDYNESLKDLMASAYGVEGAERAKYAATLAGKEGMAGLLAILNTSDEDYKKLKKSIDGASDAYNGQGTAAGMAQTMLDNLDGQVTILKSTLESLAISIGDMLLPYIKSFVAWLQSLVEWLNGLDDGQKRTLIRIAAIVAAIGPLMIIGGKVVKLISTIVNVVTFFTTTVVPCIKAIGMLKAGFTGAGLVLEGFSKGIVGVASKLAILTGPVGVVIAAIAALVAAFVVLWNKSEAFRNFWINLWNKLKSTTKTIIDAIAKFFTKTLPDALKKAETFVKNFPENFVNFMKNLPRNVGLIIGKVAGSIASFAVNIAKKGAEAGKKFVENVVKFFKNLPKNVATFLTNVVTSAIKFVKEFPEKAREASKKFGNMLINGLKSLPGKMLSIGKNIIDGIVKGIKNAWGSAKKAVSDFAGGVVDGFKSAFQIHSPSKVMKEKIGYNIVNGLIAGVKAKKGEAKKAASEVSQDIVDAAKTKLDVLQTYNKISEEGEILYWQSLLGHLKKGSSAYLEAYKSYKEAKQKYNEEIKNMESEYKEKVTTVYSDLKNEVTDLTKAYKDQVASRKEALLSSFKLFDKYEISTDKSGKDLTDNLQSQVDALQQFNGQMEKLEGRKILPKSLITELREQGVAATGELTTLNAMTSDQLKQYADLWKQRNKLAKEEADRENKEAYDKLQGDIAKAQSAAYKKLDKLATQYEKKLKKMKNNAYDSANIAGKKTVKGLVDGINKSKNKLEKTLGGILDTVSSYMSKMNAKVADYNSKANSVSHSHRQGLTYVPYDGYQATLHEGERVLTKEEAKNQTSGGDTFIFNSPKAIDEREAARQMKLAKKQLAMDY